MTESEIVHEYLSAHHSGDAAKAAELWERKYTCVEYKQRKVDYCDKREPIKGFKSYDPVYVLDPEGQCHLYERIESWGTVIEMGMFIPYVGIS